MKIEEVLKLSNFKELTIDELSQAKSTIEESLSKGQNLQNSLEIFSTLEKINATIQDKKCQD